VYATAVYLGSFYTTSAQTDKLPSYTEVTAGVVGHLLANRMKLRVGE
jgi:phytoene/squalene synthetase